MIALIMAGGFGTRFWPQSRKAMPKQFLKVAGDRSMIQLTVERLLPKIPIKDIFVVTAADQVELMHEHLPDMPAENIIIEPFGMNTAACIALSAQYLKPRYPARTSMIVLPADHVIRDHEAFLAGLDKADTAASEKRLVTFGIVPEYPATGYGYIEAGEEISEGILAVKRFKEKPDLDTAKAFLDTGGFYWNSGMFCWSIATIRDAFARYLPKMHELCLEIGRTWQEDGYQADISAQYRQMPRLPIDIGIMEKAEARCVIPVDLGWNDVGSFKALADISPADKDGNYSEGELCAIDSSGNFIQTDKYTALIGVDDLCVIQTPDALLITRKDRAEDVKIVVDKLRQDQREDLL